MARPLRLEFPGALWHITSRGNDRKEIYFSDDDRTFFVDLLGAIVTRYGWHLYAWVEMTNHYHLFLQTPQPNLSRGMRDLNGEYAQFINARRRRCGHLFQHRFKGTLVEKESHFLEVSRYVVLNPVRAGMVETTAEWPWSSYRATAGLATPPPWLDTDSLLRAFHRSNSTEARRIYREFVAAGVGLTDSPWEKVIANLFLGSEQFLESMKRLLEQRELSNEYPRAQRSPLPRTIDQIASAVASARPLTSGCNRRDRTEARALIAYFARAEVVALKIIAGALGVSVSRASRLADSGESVLRKDTALRRRIESELAKGDSRSPFYE